MKRILLFAFCCSLMACQSEEKPTDSEAVSLPVKEEKVKPATPQAEYSMEFIERFKDLEGLGELDLAGPYIVMGKDSIPFPDYLPVGKSLSASAKTETIKINIAATRINYSSIKYVIDMSTTDGKQHHSEGEAHLSPGFILGDEIDESSISGMGYAVSEYSTQEDDCYTSIRIGREPESGNQLLCKIIKNCNGEIPDIDLEDFPTLVQEQ